MTTLTPLPAALYVVATPLGNLGDVTLRALDVLKRVSCIACEDTRVTRDLLRLLEIAPPPLISVREHNERTEADSIVAKIAAGEAIAYSSDAGTPAISDPGARLVEAVRAAGLSVIPIPGVSAVTTALSVAGFADTAFTFLGFAPTSTAGFAAFVDAVALCNETAVFFESPHRAQKTLQSLAETLRAQPTRRVLIARELTKKFESIDVVIVSELANWAAAHEAQMRGEFVIAVEGAPKAERATSLESSALLKALLEELPPAKAAKLVAKLTGEPREALYALAESMRPKK
jgi:16S rRNA (cytidine1402-2'-O)-methyltransferase